MNKGPTHDCGCNLRHGIWQPCPEGWLFWTFATQKYAEAVESGDWRLYLEARWMLCNHYGFKPWDADAYYVNMERRYRKLALADQYQLERWIENDDPELKPHALVEWGLRFDLDYPNQDENKTVCPHCGISDIDCFDATDTCPVCGRMVGLALSPFEC